MLPGSLTTASSHGVLVRPSPGGGLVPESVGLAHVGDLRDERVVRVGVGEQRADGEQHLGDRQRGAPLLLEDVQADVPVAVDVRVEHLRLERHLHSISCEILQLVSRVWILQVQSEIKPSSEYQTDRPLEA